MRGWGWVGALLPLAGCGDTLKVESDSAWHGVIGGRTVSDSGFASFDVDQYPFCWALEKDSTTGYLRAYVEGGFLEPRSGDRRTESPGGVVNGCDAR